MKTVQVKNNHKYQKDINKSFAVIYHNLKRIRDNAQHEEKRSQEEPFNPELLQLHLLEDTSNSEKEASRKVTKKRVSFAVDEKEGM